MVEYKIELEKFVKGFVLGLIVMFLVIVLGGFDPMWHIADPVDPSNTDYLFVSLMGATVIGFLLGSSQVD